MVYMSCIIRSRVSLVYVYTYTGVLKHVCEVAFNTCVGLEAGAEERANMSKRVAKPSITPYVPYSERRNERCWRWSGNRQTDTHT